MPLICGKSRIPLHLLCPSRATPLLAEFLFFSVKPSPTSFACCFLIPSPDLLTPVHPSYLHLSSFLSLHSVPVSRTFSSPTSHAYPFWTSHFSKCSFPSLSLLPCLSLTRQQLHLLPVNLPKEHSLSPAILPPPPVNSPHHPSVAAFLPNFHHMKEWAQSSPTPSLQSSTQRIAFLAQKSRF